MVLFLPLVAVVVALQLTGSLAFAPTKPLAATRSTEKSVHEFYTKFSSSSDLEILSLDPLVLYVKNFLSKDVCKALIASAEDKGFKRSTVLNEGETSDVRTSATCWLREDDCAASAALLAPITERVAAMSEQPASHQENLQVVRYGPEQEYQEHTDHIDSFNELEFGGRMSTCLIYLNGGDDFDGGRTAFPRLTPRAAPVVPEAGAALFFVNVRLPCADPFAMAVHEASLHAGLPLTRGTKYVCNKWVHPVPMQRAEPAE